MHLFKSLLLAALLCACLPANAHGPWPVVCCSDRDCAEVASKYIRETGNDVHITIPPGEHPMWPADGRPAFATVVPRASLRKAVTGEWGVCISPTGSLLCVFPPHSGV